MSPDFVMRLGWAAGRVLAPDGGGTVVIGKDTRISGYMFESALEAGLAAAGMNIRLLGPMPTPGIAYLTRTMRANAGIVISASHNPFYDNGIKFFCRDGKKLPDELELAIEAAMGEPFQTVASEHLGNARRVEDAAGRYIEFCKHSVPYGVTLAGLKLVVDCANGAGYAIAPPVFREMGASVDAIGASPDGLNINRDCGSTHPDALRERVVATGADLGIALDGDGDRLIMVDHTGELVDGDELLFIIARSRLEQGLLAGPVVGTLMSNLGLELAISGLGLEFRRAGVGDRYVMAMLEETGGILGGESSGHLICLDRTTTGDGIISALQVLWTMVDSGRSLAELKTGMEKLPQRLINVRVENRMDLEASEVRQAVQRAEKRLDGNGRVLLRASGTEPVVRVMCEGREATLVEGVCADLAEEIERCSRQHARPA
jgi:phosphoglucosamine mutase